MYPSRQVFEHQMELLLDLVHNAPVGIACVDSDLRYISINEQLAAMNGLPAPEHLGKFVRDVVPSLEPEVKRIVQDIAQTGQPLIGHELAGETMVSPGELRHWRESWFPVKNLHGEIAAYGVMVEDITDAKRAEKELRAAEARLQSAMFVAGAGTWDIDLATGRHIWSESHFTLFGYEPTPDRVADESYWRNVISPEHLPGMMAEWERAQREHDVFRSEHAIHRANDGAKVLIRSAGRFFYDETGRATRFVGAFVDVTQERATEATLKGLTTDLRHIMDTAGIALTRCSRDLQYLAVNQDYAQLVGRSVEELQGASIIDVLGDEAFALIEPFVNRVLQGERVEYETSLPLKNGTSKYVKVVYTPWVNNEHDVLGWVASISDLSARREMEEQLRDSEQRYRQRERQLRLLTDAMPALVAYIDRQLIYRFNNRAYEAWYGLPTDEIAGKSMYEVLGEGAMEKLGPYVEQVLQGHDVHFELEVPYRLGGQRWINAHYMPDIAEGGGVAGFFVLVLDVTDRKATEEKLRGWNVELENAVAEKTAELTQTHARLRALATELNLAEQRERQRLAVDLHDNLQQILVLARMKLGQGKRIATDEASEALLNQVDEVLAEALAYTRTLVSDLSPPALREFGLAAGLRWLRDYMKRHDMEVTVSLHDEQELHLPEDQAMLLFQSVRELLINAWKHSSVPEAEVSLYRDYDTLVAEVRDEGKGFDVDAPAPPDAASGSSQFGLFSIRERMYALGGEFKIESMPGKGTRAALRLPLTPPPKTRRKHRAGADLHQATGQVPGEHVADGGGMRIVLVDDHLIVRQGLRSLLESYPDLVLVGEAGDGIEAVNLVERLRPEVVVMDIDMPRMNGIEATAHIKEHHPDVTVIGLSVNAGGENQDAMRKAGAITLLPKEAAADQLYETIMQCAKTSAS